ncbi:MAG TPA: hypothetical protein VHG30_06430 [Microvirga sp.]|nr:hypothetical protein [Microvirga sp.]
MRRAGILVALAMLAGSSALAQSLGPEQQAALTAVATVMTANDVCGFGIQEEALVAHYEGQGLETEEFTKGRHAAAFEQLLDWIDAMHKSLGKERFCEQAWSMYGERGSAAAGLLSRP